MKPALEILALEQNRSSFNFFEVATAAFKPYWHYHPELELTLITKGWGTRFVGNSISPYKQGDLVLLGKNLPHHWVSADDSADQAAIVIQFPPTLLASFRECDRFNGFFKDAQAGFHFIQPEHKALEIFNQMGSYSDMGRIGGLINLLELLQNDPNRKSLSSLAYPVYPLFQQEQTKISKTITYILEHINERLTVNQLSDVTHMVPQSFCRWFRKSVGMSFLTFLNSARVENACHELITTDKPILEIAHKNGFDSISHFNRTFKKVKGETPSLYRNRGLGYH